MSEPAVLVLANNVVHDVRQQARHHQDLHVVTLPAVLQRSRNLQRQSKVRRITPLMDSWEENRTAAEFWIFAADI